MCMRVSMYLGAAGVHACRCVYRRQRGCITDNIRTGLPGIRLGAAEARCQRNKNEHTHATIQAHLLSGEGGHDAQQGRAGNDEVDDYGEGDATLPDLRHENACSGGRIQR